MTDDKTTLFRMPGGMMAELKCHRGAREGETFSLSSGTFVIGRSSGNDLVLSKDSGVSKIHAKIIAEDEKYLLVDNESRNGTLVNGKPITKQVLQHGDEIQICGCRLTFLSLGATALNEPNVTIQSKEEEQIQSLTQSGDENRQLTMETDSAQTTKPKFYSDENAHDQEPPMEEEIDEYADTLQPIERDTLMGEEDKSEDSMTVTAAMVDSAVSASAAAALKKVKEVRGDAPKETKTVSYQDMRTITGQKPPSQNGLHEGKRSASPSKSRSFLLGVLIALVGYSGWLVSHNSSMDDLLPATHDIVIEDKVEEQIATPSIEQQPKPMADEMGIWYDVKFIGHNKLKVKSPTSGSLSSVNVTNGEPVFVGQSAFTVSNDRLSSDIETIKLEIKALERLAGTNKSEFVRQGLKEERQKLRTLISKQKRIVKVQNAGTVSGLKKKAGAYVKKGEVLFSISGVFGLPRFILENAKEVEITEGMRVEVKSKAGKVSKAMVATVSTRGQDKELTFKGTPRSFKVKAFRVQKP